MAWCMYDRRRRGVSRNPGVGRPVRSGLSAAGTLGRESRRRRLCGLDHRDRPHHRSHQNGLADRAFGAAPGLPAEGSIEGEWLMQRISRWISGDEFAAAAIEGTTRFSEGTYELSWQYLVSGAGAHEAGTYTLVADCLITCTAAEGTANLTGGHTPSYSFPPHDHGESALLDLRSGGALMLRIALTRGGSTRKNATPTGSAASGIGFRTHPRRFRPRRGPCAPARPGAIRPA